jgi:hypothetical protein
MVFSSRQISPKCVWWHAEKCLYLSIRSVFEQQLCYTSVWFLSCTISSNRRWPEIYDSICPSYVAFGLGIMKLGFNIPLRRIACDWSSTFIDQEKHQTTFADFSLSFRWYICCDIPNQHAVYLHYTDGDKKIALSRTHRCDHLFVESVVCKDKLALAERGQKMSA